MKRSIHAPFTMPGKTERSGLGSGPAEGSEITLISNAEAPTNPFDFLKDLGYTLRRFYVDDFHFRHVPDLSEGSLVLDLGGNRVGKRGAFDIERFPLHVVYANLSVAKKPHVQTDAAVLPFGDATFDAVVCSEMLEHVFEPRDVLAEIHRVLHPGGTLLVCVPFMNRIHGDPYDFGRYTDHYWSRALDKIGFRDIQIEKQGLFWSVLVDLLRDPAYVKTSRGPLRKPWIIGPVSSFMAAAKRKALQWDSANSAGGDVSPQGYTTGFGIRARK